MRICVYGAASATLDQKYLSDAYRLGEAMAQQQIGLVYGGGATGMMGAVAEGVYAHQGEIIGVSPEFFCARRMAFICPSPSGRGAVM